jgi:aminomethyltransferase
MKTVLYDAHVALKAKMVEFCGWSMPVLYRGVIEEHQCVRNHAGLFDVSHMGRISIVGEDAEAFMDHLSTNKIAGKEDLTATYTVWCNEYGKAVDDLIVYKESKDKFFVIVNAGNRDKDLAHLKQHLNTWKVVIQDHYKEGGILALQGPKALQVVEKVIPGASKIKPMHFARFNGDLIVAGTGYTGASGVEIYADNETIAKLWGNLLAAGRDEQIAPIGLGARDTLRLEMGYALYGHELSDEIAPTESVSHWTVKYDGRHFLGKEALMALEPHKRYQCGIVLIDKGIARENYPVLQDGKVIGRVTSGTLSPTLNQSIAIVLVDKNLKLDDIVEVQVRQNLCRAKVVKLPFYSARKA